MYLDEEIKPVDEEVIAMATDLLEKWSSLKEVFRIPKKIVPVRSRERERERERHYYNVCCRN